MKQQKARKNEKDFLRKAKVLKNDEFYTQLKDIENELQHYEKHFLNKIVFCNCDDPLKSNFVKYFVNNFKKLGLKKLIAACYLPKIIKHENNNTTEVVQQGYYCEFSNKSNLNKQITLEDVTFFESDGDFRSFESIALLKQADIVVTNPPFSLFREFVDQLVMYNKKFLIIGNINAITYKNVFSLIQNNQAWLGVNLGRGISGFIVPKNYETYGSETKVDEFNNKIIATNNCLWLTNLDNFKRNQELDLKMHYFGNEVHYPKYDNYNGINVNYTKNIPYDYSGHMGVPITFLHKFNPQQFEIIRFRKGDDGKDLRIQGKQPYFRIVIKNKRIKDDN